MLTDGKLITVWESRGNLGGTFTAINLAQNISQYEKDTILVDLNLIQPRIAEYLSLEDKTHSLDNLYPFALGEAITKDIIETNCNKTNDLSVLKGTLNPSFSDFVKVEILDIILQSLKKHYKYVILDVHSSLNNPGTYLSLEKSDEVYVVLDKDVMSVLSLSDSLNYIKFFDTDKFLLLFNKDTKNVFITKEEICNTLGFPKLGELPLLPIDIVNYINKGEFSKIKGEKAAKKYFKDLDKIIIEKILKNKNIKPLKKKSLFKWR